MVPWLDKYIRHSFRDTMKKWKRKDKGEEVYVDIDGIGEMVDTFRGMGLTEASDPYCCEGSAYLLRVQLKNGSFPLWFEQGQVRTTRSIETRVLSLSVLCVTQISRRRRRLLMTCSTLRGSAHRRCAIEIFRSLATLRGSGTPRSCCDRRSFTSWTTRHHGSNTEEEAGVGCYKDLYGSNTTAQLSAQHSRRAPTLRSSAPPLQCLFRGCS